MDTPPRRRCQTVLAAFVGGLICLLATANADSSSAPAPTPPPAWRTDLDAVHLLESAAALSDASLSADPAAAKARRQRVDKLYRTLAERYPNQPEILRARGDFFWRNGESAAAVPCWERAQILVPADAETAESLGSAYLQLGRVRDAAAQFGRAVDARPDQPLYHFALANVLYLFRQELTEALSLPDAEAVLRRALEHFRRAAELAPADLRLAQAYAETFYILAKPDWQTALLAWQAVLKLSNQDTDFANGHLARVSVRLGHGAEAKKYLAEIHNPAFAPMKTKLLQQADKLTSTPAGNPAAKP